MAGMGQPKPKVALDNECSAVYNNTLYAYQADAFQSLSLETGAVWATLDQGESVSDAVCVNVDSSDVSSAALWIVGGTGGSDGYKGLQRYTYATGKWESITPVTAVTENRINHGAIYLPGSDNIVVYAGSQDGTTGMSTQTFSINASAPYSVLAYESDGAPPATSPTLLRWSDSEAVMVGGSSTNVQVMTFAVGAGWTNSGATLATPLKTGTDKWHASLVTGSDGSKSLYTFDMTVAPNVANRTLIVDSHGAPVTDAVATTKRWETDPNERRSTTLSASDWPSYNGTYASSAIRSNSAAAESSDGQVVLSGGNMDDVICIFNENANSWINATELLASDGAQKTLHASVSSSSSSTTATATAVSSGSSTATAAAESTTAAAASSSKSSGSSSSASGLSTDQTLGVVLGSIGGAIVFLILVYCQIKKRKRRIDYIQAGHARRASGSSGNPEKEGVAVATDSYPRSPTNPNFMRAHQHHDSFSSLAIFTGKTSQPPMDGGRRPSFGGAGLNKGSQLKNQISGPIPTMTMPAIAGPLPPLRSLAPGAREEKGVSFSNETLDPRAASRLPADLQEGVRRSSGWNRYWSGDSTALNILGYGNNNPNRNTGVSEGSHYSTSGPAVTTRNDAYVDPRNRRTQDSATVPPLNMPDGPPRLSRVNSGSPTVSSHPSIISNGMAGHIGNRPASANSSLSGYSSGVPASVQDNWDPTALSSRPWTGQRATSSMYSVNHFPIPPGSPGPMPPLPRTTPSGVSQQPKLHTAHTSDMSWLNLDLRR